MLCSCAAPGAAAALPPPPPHLTSCLQLRVAPLGSPVGSSVTCSHYLLFICLPPSFLVFLVQSFFSFYFYSLSFHSSVSSGYVASPYCMFFLGWWCNLFLPPGFKSGSQLGSVQLLLFTQEDHFFQHFWWTQPQQVFQRKTTLQESGCWVLSDLLCPMLFLFKVCDKGYCSETSICVQRAGSSCHKTVLRLFLRPDFRLPASWFTGAS